MSGELLLPWDFQPQEPVEIHGEWRPSAVWLPSLGTQLLIPAGRAASNSNGPRSPITHGLAYTHDGSSQYENWQLPFDVSSARPVVIAASFIVTDMVTAVQTAFGLGGSATASGLYSGVGQYAAGTVDSWCRSDIANIDWPITGPTAVVGKQYNVIRILRGPFEADMMFVNGVAYAGGVFGTKANSGAWRNVSAGACVRDTTPIFWGKQTVLLGFVGFTDPGDAWMQTWSINPWRMFNPRSIPVSGTRRPAKRKTFNLPVPHESPPNSLVEVDSSVAYAFNAGSGMLDLANNAPNWAGSSKISLYKDGLYLDGNVNTSHRRYSSFDNRSAFIIAGRSIRDNSYSSNASHVVAIGTYGWQLRLIDYSTAIRIDFNGYWSASPCFVAYVWNNEWPGLKALNWAMAIDIPNLTYNIYLEGRAVASGVLTQVPDPVQDSGFVSIASIPSQGNVISQLCIIPGRDLVKTQELSKGVNQLFKPMEIPYASPQITTRREVSEMTLPWNSLPPENIRCDARVAFGPHGHIDIVSGRMMRVPGAHELGRFWTTAGYLGYLGAITAARRAGRRAVADTVTAGTPLGLVWVFQNTSGTDNGGARISNTDNGFRLLEMTIAAGVLSASARGSDDTSRTITGPTIATTELISAVAEWVPGVGVSLAVNGVDYGTTAFGLTALSHVPSILNDSFNTATITLFTAWLRLDQLGNRVGLSRDPWQLMKDYTIPYDQSALTRQLDPLTPTDGMTPRIYLGS